MDFRVDHIEEKNLILYVLNARSVQAHRPVIDEHLKECSGCEALRKEIAAYYDEVAEYIEERNRNGEDALAIRDRIIPFSGTAIRAERDEVAEDRSLVVRSARWIVRHRVASSISLAAALVLGALLLMPRPIEKDTNVTFARPVGEFLVAYNRTGEEVWRAHVGPQYDSLVFREVSKKLFEVLDVNGDGKNEVVSAFLQVWGEPSANRKKLLSCYNSDGSLRWQRKFQRRIAFGDSVFDDEYHFTSLQAVDFDKDGKSELISHIESALHYPSAVLRLNPDDGSVLSQYWHPGYLKYLQSGDIDRDGVEEILCAGLNHLLQRAALAIFDPRVIDGCGPATAGKEPAGFLPGTEKFYVLFPATLLRDVPGYATSYIREMYPRADGGVDVWLRETVGSQPPLSIIFVFQFDSAMRCVKVTTPDGTKLLINRFDPDEKMSQRLLSREYLEILRRGVRYWDGQSFVAEPTRTRRYRESAATGSSERL